MYKKIMVPVDLEHVDKIEKALHGAAELASSYDAPVCYVAVMGQTPSRVASRPEEFEAELDRFATEQGEKYGIQVESRAISSVDVPAELDDKLIEAVHEIGADLVVMASHVPGIPDKLRLISSNAAYMVKHSDVSIFVVR